MPLVVCGLNHHTAPVALREQAYFREDRLALHLQDLTSTGKAEEAVLLSTCNRSELYCQGEADIPFLRDWFCRQQGAPPDGLASALYCHEGPGAVQHVMEVACGLDSLIPFESQILGQMKAAFSEACAAGTVGSLFNRLFQHVFAVAKEVRTNTALGACPVSVAAAAVRFLMTRYPDHMAGARVLLLGSGLAMELVLRHLQPVFHGKLFITSRNSRHAATLATKWPGSPPVCHPMDRLQAVLAQADVLVSATGSPHPLVTADMLTDRRDRPLILLDLAVPRDIDPAVGTVPGVSLFCIDDLRDTLEQGLDTRRHAAEKAREVIAERTVAFMEWQASLDLVTGTIRAFRRRMEYACEAELQRALRQLQRGDNPASVLTRFASALTQKMLHAPSVQLRQAGLSGRRDILQLAGELFCFPDSAEDSL